MFILLSTKLKMQNIHTHIFEKRKFEDKPDLRDNHTEYLVIHFGGYKWSNF